MVELISEHLSIGPGFRLTSPGNNEKELTKIGIIFIFQISNCQKNEIFVKCYVLNMTARY